MPERHVQREEHGRKEDGDVGFRGQAPVDREDEDQQHRHGEEVAPEGDGLRAEFIEAEAQANGREAKGDAAAQHHQRAEPGARLEDGARLRNGVGHAARVIARISSGVIPSLR